MTSGEGVERAAAIFKIIFPVWKNSFDSTAAFSFDAKSKEYGYLGYATVTLILILLNTYLSVDLTPAHSAYRNGDLSFTSYKWEYSNAICFNLVNSILRNEYLSIENG